MNKFLFASLIFLVACAPTVNPTPTPQVITVYASPATQPWLSEVYKCAQGLQLIISDVNDPAQAALAIRMGEPAPLKSPAYEIGRDDLLIVTQPASPLQNLTVEQVRALFSDPGATTQIWVFAPAEDIQQVFSEDVMQGAPLTSQARLGLSPRQMSDAINNDKNVVGLLPRRWKTETARELYSLADVPVLALTQSEPHGALQELLACLQKRPAP